MKPFLFEGHLLANISMAIKALKSDRTIESLIMEHSTINLGVLDSIYEELEQEHAADNKRNFIRRQHSLSRLVFKTRSIAERVYLPFLEHLGVLAMSEDPLDYKVKALADSPLPSKSVGNEKFSTQSCACGFEFSGAVHMKNRIQHEQSESHRRRLLIKLDEPWLNTYRGFVDAHPEGDHPIYSLKLLKEWCSNNLLLDGVYHFMWVSEHFDHLREWLHYMQSAQVHFDSIEESMFTSSEFSTMSKIKTAIEEKETELNSLGFARVLGEFQQDLETHFQTHGTYSDRAEEERDREQLNQQISSIATAANESSSALPRRFSCTVENCGSTFGTKRDRREHMSTVHASRRFRCTFDGCEYTCHVEKTRTVHETKRHAPAAEPATMEQVEDHQPGEVEVDDDTYRETSSSSQVPQLSSSVLAPKPLPLPSPPPPSSVVKVIAMQRVQVLSASKGEQHSLLTPGANGNPIDLTD